MLSLIVRTKRSPEEVGRKLVSFFGSRGLGLESASEGDIFRFLGGAGRVIAVIRREEKDTVINFETREFEEPVKEFARQVG
jgi:hypothetical protein